MCVCVCSVAVSVPTVSLRRPIIYISPPIAFDKAGIVAQTTMLGIYSRKSERERERESERASERARERERERENAFENNLNLTKSKP